MDGKTLYDAAARYIGLGRARFHTPGHKGRSVPPFPEEMLRFDLTECDGLDSLLHPTGAIARLQERLADIYGSSASLISAGGSTLCIQAMLACAAAPGGRVVMGRNAHVSAVNALALLDMEPVWIYPDFGGRIDPGDIRRALEETKNCRAVYVTSPDYCGAISDIPALSELCRAAGVPLLVDNAHGAHLKFTAPSLHPMDAGADFCCDSLHKTLPVLTGGALLHVREREDAPRAARMLRLFASTSPSYLIMLSIDSAAAYMESRAAADIAALAPAVARVYEAARTRGFAVPGGMRDPIRITLPLKGSGYPGEGFAAHLRSFGVEPEYCSDSACVLLPPLYGGERDFERLLSAIEGAEPVWEDNFSSPELFALPVRAMSIREAVFAQSETVQALESAGRVSAQSAAVCPPGIPIVVPGELIDENTAIGLKSNGICHIDVVK